MNLLPHEMCTATHLSVSGSQNVKQMTIEQKAGAAQSLCVQLCIQKNDMLSRQAAASWLGMASISPLPNKQMSSYPWLQLESMHCGSTVFFQSSPKLNGTATQIDLVPTRDAVHQRRALVHSVIF